MTLPLGIALVALLAAAPGAVPPEDPDARARVLVLTDIADEPDDEESLVRFLVSSNQYDVEGLVATTSTHLRERTRLDLIRRQVEAYAKVRPNLLVHAAGFPSVEHLLAVATTGQPGYGMAAVGEGRTTHGSRLILEAADRTDERPLWVSVWGGANTLAQALWDVRRSRSAEEVGGSSAGCASTRSRTRTTPARGSGASSPACLRRVALDPGRRGVLAGRRGPASAATATTATAPGADFTTCDRRAG